MAKPRIEKSLYSVLPLVRTDDDVRRAFGSVFIPSSCCVIALFVMFVWLNGTSITSFVPRNPVPPVLRTRLFSSDGRSSARCPSTVTGSSS